MYAFKSLVALLVLSLAASVSAHPSSGHSSGHFHRRHHRARGLHARTCSPRANTNASDVSGAISANTTTAEAQSASAHASSTHSSAAAAATGHVLNTGFSALAPVANPLKEWSTAPSAPNALPLSDAAFRPHNAISELTHSYVNAPDGQLSMQAIYPKGSWNFKQEPRGGFSFYAPGPADVDLTTAKEVTFGYSVFFPEGFEFQLGGKMPGIYGGDSDEVALSCSGGKRDDRCMSARLMWRQDGAGEMYTYLPPGSEANQAVCNVKPKSECNKTYGASVGRGSFKFEAGKSTAVAMRVRLNDAGKENGELELWADGNSVINVGGLVLRDSDAGRIRGLMMQTFFGGSTSNYASPKDQKAYFRDFTIAITEKL